MDRRIRRRLEIPGEVSPVGLKLPKGLFFEQWETIVAQLLMVTRACMWWWGDALAYGERKYGAMYKQALARADYDYQTLRDAVWVSGRFELSRRRDKLSWSHHREVAALEPQQQDALLDQAETEKMTRDELRRAVRQLARQGEIAKLLAAHREIAATDCNVAGRWINKIHQGDCVEIMRQMPGELRRPCRHLATVQPAQQHRQRDEGRIRRQVGECPTGRGLRFARRRHAVFRVRCMAA
jgi:hypothetical protein